MLSLIKCHGMSLTKDVIFIPKDEKAKHKAILGKGEKVILLLFEIID